MHISVNERRTRTVRRHISSRRWLPSEETIKLFSGPDPGATTATLPRGMQAALVVGFADGGGVAVAAVRGGVPSGEERGPNLIGHRAHRPVFALGDRGFVRPLSRAVIVAATKGCTFTPGAYGRGVVRTSGGSAKTTSAASRAFDSALLAALRSRSVLKEEPGAKAIWLFQQMLRVAAGIDAGRTEACRALFDKLMRVYASISVKESNLAHRTPRTFLADFRRLLGTDADLVRFAWPAVHTFLVSSLLNPGPRVTHETPWEERFPRAMLVRPGTADADEILRTGKPFERRIVARWLEMYLVAMITMPGDRTLRALQSFACKTLLVERWERGDKLKKLAWDVVARLAARRAPVGTYKPEADDTSAACEGARAYAIRTIRYNLRDTRDTSHLAGYSIRTVRKYESTRGEKLTAKSAEELRDEMRFKMKHHQPGLRTLQQIATAFDHTRDAVRHAERKAVAAGALRPREPGKVRHFTATEERILRKYVSARR
jgi:hypothetical protein